MQNSNVRSGKNLLRNVRPNSQHSEFWLQAKVIMKSMKFITPKGCAGTVPSIANWVKTLDNMGILKDVLFKKYNIKSFWCRHLNQDHLENFFGSIRSHGVRNNSPTCAGFEAAFTSALVNNLSSNYSPGSNCEDDACSMFESFSNIFFSEDKKLDQTCEVDYNDIINDNIIVSFTTKQKDPRIIAQLEYVTGYMLRKAKKIIKNCKQCRRCFYSNDPTNNKYLACREYTNAKKYLCYPSEDLSKCFSEIQDVLHHILKSKSEINNLKNYMKTILYINLNTDFIICSSHKKEFVEFIFDFSSRFFAHNWCKWTNKLLNGVSTAQDVDLNDEIQKDSAIYYKKRRRRAIK